MTGSQWGQTNRLGLGEVSQEEEQHRPPAGVTVPEDRNCDWKKAGSRVELNWYSWVLLGRIDGGLLKAARAAQ